MLKTGLLGGLINPCCNLRHFTQVQEIQLTCCDITQHLCRISMVTANYVTPRKALQFPPVQSPLVSTCPELHTGTMSRPKFPIRQSSELTSAIIYMHEGQEMLSPQMCILYKVIFLAKIFT